MSEPWAPTDAPHPADVGWEGEPRVASVADPAPGPMIVARSSEWHHGAADRVCEIIAADPVVHLDRQRALLWVDDAPGSTAAIRYADGPMVVDMLGRQRVTVAVETSKGPVPVKTPPELVATALSRRTPSAPWRTFRGFASGPYLLRTGAVVDKQGPNAKTNLWLPFSGLAELPTTGDAMLHAEGYEDRALGRAMLDTLLKPLNEFPWADPDLDPAVWLGYLMTLVTRPAYDTAPMFLFEASRRRSGKDLLFKLAERVAHGREAFRLTFDEKPEEDEKRIATALMGGHTTIIMADTKRIGTPLILSLITEGANVIVRLLGTNTAIPVPPTLTLGANGNNVSLNMPDLIPRMIALRLEPKTERPETVPHEMNQDELRDHYTEQRGPILGVLFNALRAYINRTEDAPRGITCGTFPGWSALVRDALLWYGYPDIVATQDRLMQTAQVGDDGHVGTMIAAWWNLRRDMATTSGQLIDIARTEGDPNDGPDPDRLRLADALRTLLDGKLSAKTLTGYLAKLRGTVHTIDGMAQDTRVQMVQGRHNNQQTFSLKRM